MPLPRNQRNKKKKKVGGPPSGAVRAARENALAKQSDAPAASDAMKAEDSSSDATLLDEGTVSPQKNGKRSASSEATPASEEPDTEIVFEDPFGDDFESEDDDVDPKKLPTVNEDEVMIANDRMVFRPGVDKLQKGEALVCDETAYDTFHRIRLEWPSLSFDVIGQAVDGSYSNMNTVRQESYPLSVSIVLGTQASEPKKNKLVFLKMSNLHRTRGKDTKRKPKRVRNIEHSDSDDSSEEEEEDDEGATPVSEDGVMQSAEIKHDCTVNRVRAMPQHANIVAVWGESGRVSLVDGASALDALNRDSRRRMSDGPSPSAVRPFFSFTEHRCEGYALDWSRVEEARLLSGGCNGSIYLWAPGDRGGAAFAVSPDRFRGHRGSVEDLQWSPNEANVFASCGVDKSVRFWDTRNYRKPALTVPDAHSEDVNVISWNRREGHLVVSGGDDAVIKVWDLRALKGGGGGEAKPAAEFKQHTKAITSVQWHPTDASMLAASSEDGCVSVWDLAVERDAEEELRDGVVIKGAEQFPPQLLFIHMGQTNVKETQWHPACPSLLLSTAEDGLNLFKPSNITLPD